MAVTCWILQCACILHLLVLGDEAPLLQLIENDAVFDTGEREHLREREKLGGEVERRALAVRAEREEFRAETEELESE